MRVRVGLSPFPRRDLELQEQHDEQEHGDDAEGP